MEKIFLSCEQKKHGKRTLHRKMRTLLLLFVFGLTWLSAVAAPTEQQRTIRGRVIGEAGDPIPGVTVVVKGTTVGTITDLDGKFNLSVPANATTLAISFVGMTAQEIPITAQSDYNVTMKEETKGLEEVVVVGYGTQKKESVVGAITQVNNETLMQAGATTVTNAIAGKLSGVLTIQRDAEPGSSDADIYVRGLSSWNGSGPLVLVDGVERDFSQVNPNEINSISVLKDASATAVFGARGANGVVIVTTKRGVLGKPNMDFSASYGMQVATRIPKFIDSYTTLKDLNVAFMNGQQFSSLIPEAVLNEYKNPSSALNALRYPNVNWFDELTNPVAPLATANMNVSGGTEFAKYFLAFGYQ
jgi:TonB-linked SusC/RagA family outer membrane protein